METRQLIVALLCAVALVRCTAAPQRWEVEELPQPADVDSLLSESGVTAVHHRMMPSEVPPIPVRERLRPCCAFGSDLKAKLGPVPVPAYQIPNIIGPEDVGRHGYDSGTLRLGSDEGPGVQFNAENNGLVYTCRGGFVDTAHVRDYVDWTVFAAGQVATIVSSGQPGEFSLPDEGGKRRVLVAAVDPEVVQLLGLRRVAAFSGAYVAWFMSVWHELATWYGYASVPGFSEKASAFSLEDLYSNGLGAKLGALLVDRRLAHSERTFRRSVDDWLPGILSYLGAVPAEVGKEAAESVDGLWWDSTVRLPDYRLVKRRSVEPVPPIRPWLIPRDRMPDSLRAACGSAPEPALIEVRKELTRSVAIADIATLEVVVDEAWREQQPFKRMGRKVTDRDFPAIAEEVRRQILAEFGPGADRPD